MAYSLRVTALAAKLNLNNGSTATGTVKTVSVPIGGSSQKINVTAYMTDESASRGHVAALADVIEPILTKTVYTVTETTEGKIMED